ncbi:MAG TPA: acetamidase/formamidase family protein [Bryobacteraceae bacterium]|nr:acetamidase/formamidase family protein [Bryobacteraceae bacterium]
MLSCALAKTVVFEPKIHSNVFSASKSPVLRIQPGDTVDTKTWDAVGQDQKGVARVANPYTYPELRNALNGPFYVEGAAYGDTLEIHLDKVALNRNWGYTTYRLIPSFLDPRTVENLYRNSFEKGAVRPERDNLVKWDLDLASGMATARMPSASPAQLRFPVKPMLGCIGVAPPGEESHSSGTSGAWGGNMDYNDVVEGATLLLPVFHPGAYFFIGDGHALQGDGEGLGMGIETSMDVRFTVKVRKNQRLSMPRLINDEYIISIASQPEYNSNLDLALQRANSDMISWLTSEYGFTPQQAHLLLGVAAQHKIVTYFGTVTTMIPRKFLPKK